MLGDAETEKVLRKFAKKVVAKARKNARQNAYASGSMAREMDFNLNFSKNSFSLSFLTTPYGVFNDAGVRGANPSLVKNGIQKAPLSKFRFKKKKPPVEPLIKWAKLKRIRFRDKKGKYKKGNYRAIGFWLQSRIFAQGLKPTLFFTKPYIDTFKTLPDEVIKAYGIDISDFILNKEK